MIEDDIYRTSTQYRLWSFTEESLRSIRTNTNALASERVRIAIRHAKEARPSNTPATDPGDVDGKRADAKNGEQTEKELECLTPEEELELVRYYCEKAVELGEVYKPPIPTTVRVRRRSC
jgi:cyclin H